MRSFDLFCRFMLAFAVAAIFCGVIGVLSVSKARSQELHEYSPGMVPPTAQEAEDIKEWIPVQCCRTNNCCFKIPAAAIIPISRDSWIVVATGQERKRTGWSRDGQTWRCACDHTDKGWKVHLKANTRCVFPAPAGY